MIQDLTFQGADFDQERDGARLTGQIHRVYTIMKDRKWRTVSEIQIDIFKKFAIKDPENSIQAQLRNLRKPEFGKHSVERIRREKTNVSEYQLQTTYYSKQATPEVIKIPPLLEITGNTAKLTRVIPKEEWVKIDADLRKQGFDYRGYGLWKK